MTMFLRSFPLRRFGSPRALATLMLTIAVAVGALLAATPMGLAIERALEPARFALLSRPASGRLVVVENDAASVAAIKHWPWPRGYYAQAIDRLRLAGAASITFDIDFSSPSTPDGDAALAAGLGRANGLVALPTFGQQAGSGERRMIDSLPLPAFRARAALASVSMLPNADGMVRQAPWGTITAGTPRPSLAATIAHRSGAADSFFPIDYATDPNTIPRLSFVAVRDGNFDPARVRGKDVLIGATAVELGDRFGAPRWGVIPGVIIQALAAETLIRGTPTQGHALPGIMLALILALAVVRARTPLRLTLTTACATAALIAIATLEQASLHFYPVVPALGTLWTAAAARAGSQIWRRFEEQRLADDATGLPNRRAMLGRMVEKSASRVAVAHIANFDALAAVLGEQADRDLIGRVVDRLKLASNASLFRIADRLLAFELPPGEDEEALMAGLRAILLPPVEVGGRRVDVTVTVGVAEVGHDAAAALTRAAMAAEAAARDGHFWARDAADFARLEREVSLMGELDGALAQGHIEVHYQPKLALAEDRVVSVEALVRWRHPERGFIGPDLFIPLAEQAGRIAPLTLYVIERTMHDLVHWRALGHTLTAAVNISAKLVASTEFNAAVSRLLARAIVPPNALIFEVTESATLAEPEVAARALERFRALGIAISMDDYGTGQSTLTYLRQLPLSELKIDRSFVQHLHRNRNDAVLVRSTVELAHELGLKVVAEGVEDEECLAALRALGCDMAQGYFISRPLPAPALVTFLAERIVRAA